MNLESLENTAGARKRRKRIGCGMGSGHGKTSTRGHKGQMARKGSSHKEGFEGGQMRLIRLIPKRGFKNPTRVSYTPVNVGDFERFDPGTEVTREVLESSGVLRKVRGGVKVLGRGEITRKLTVKAQAFSASGRAKIEAAGGTCEVTAV